jgi:hypothetical protein
MTSDDAVISSSDLAALTSPTGSNIEQTIVVRGVDAAVDLTALRIDSAPNSHYLYMRITAKASHLSVSIIKVVGYRLQQFCTANANCMV